jgi:hypothetical protein
MMVKDLIRQLLNFPMNAPVKVSAYEDGPMDEEGEPPSNRHSVVTVWWEPFVDDNDPMDAKTVVLATYPERWS